MPETIVLPPEDIRDFVAIQHDADGKIRVKVVEAKKHITSVQRYLTLLRSRYPEKISKFDFTTLDVIAALNSNNTERAPGVLSDGGINTVQRKVLDYIRKAAQLNASDLHITPGRDNTDFTYVEARVHGELEVLDILRKEEGLELLGATYSGMTDVIKGTQFDPGVPQDARLSEQYLKLAGLFGARYSHYPCVGGLYAVLRLIKDDSQQIPTFSMLGYHPEQERTLRRILQRPEGIITLSGPTGSGKSTTLRTASAAYLEQYGFNNTGGILLPRRRLFTIESPPEGRIPGAIQTAVMDTAQGWVDSIKSALRLDPDGILNGEIRDHDSAITAIKAAMTGHLMLTTIHANDPINILERLEMEGVQTRMIADPQLFIGLLSQRLVQLICPHCRRPWHEVATGRTDDERHLVEGFCNPEQVYLRNHEGCPHCWRGVTGRTVIAEVISPDARFFQLYREKGRIEAKTYWHRELGGMTRNQHLQGKINSGQVDPLAAHYISPIDEDSYTLLH
ncbi:Flp pilus assembly complex ATPase component [Escherichia coli]|nr:Flp pilus assembly complex ATPase component [Escherichia coli]EEY8569627.1 Flp pilus assembly complex ATPase component [Escherichia coli]EFB7817333.1 Flp pilus assembly complex ATPase component [Escherichia coli]EFJ4152661.1 Flp pilus assembly complex ATPase component [Escherichia coli]HAI8447426.1 Flp pilus assembly complex ATPase component [Escherichia coli]